jgi:hypothetical protein
MRNRKKVITGLLVLLVLWIVIAAVATYRSYRTRLEADDFLGDFQKIQVQKSGINQASSLALKYEGKWRTIDNSHGGAACGSGASAVEFLFDNRFLHWLTSAPLTTLSAEIYIKGDHACFRSLSLTATKTDVTGVTIEEFGDSPFSTPFSSRLMTTKAIITMDTRASTEARAAAYSLNLNCLTAVGGCRDTKEMVPDLWRNSREVAPTLWKSQWDD